MSPQRHALQHVLQTLDNAAQAQQRPVARLVAVSKTRSAADVAQLASFGQGSFGENYVQEGIEKIVALQDLGLDWHFIGHLQSNKCQLVARHFDWVQSLDREKLVEPLHRFRPDGVAPLNVLIQVNPDGEAGKSGCEPAQVAAIAKAISQCGRLRLRGLMAIPEPTPDLAQRRQTFSQLQAWFDALRRDFPDVDTLSMGMSEDYELAVAEGASMVRIGSALFGPRT